MAESFSVTFLYRVCVHQCDLIKGKKKFKYSIYRGFFCFYYIYFIEVLYIPASSWSRLLVHMIDLGIVKKLLQFFKLRVFGLFPFI